MNNLKFIEPKIYFWIYEEKLVIKTLAFPNRCDLSGFYGWTPSFRLPANCQGI